MKETGVYVHVYHTDLELLSAEGELSFGEYVQVLEETMGAAFVARSCPRQIKKAFVDEGKGGERG